MSPKKSTKKIGYQEAIDQLEEIVNAIEEDSLDIDTLSDEVQRALALIEHCRTKLRNTEESIQQAFDQNPPEDSDEG